MLLTLRAQYSAGVTPRAAADAVISALTPAAWYRNATGVTESGGFASQWDDYSGNARHLVQATGTNQPAYAAGVFTFDGADNYMVASTWSQTQPTSIVAVVNLVTWTNGDTAFDGTSSALVGSVWQNGVTPGIVLRAGTSAASNTNLAINTRGVLCGVINGASSSLRVNDTAKTTGDAGASNMGGFILGCRFGPSSYVHGAFEEVIIFSAALSDAEQDDVITALNNALTVF